MTVIIMRIVYQVGEGDVDSYHHEDCVSGG